jgi:hypothetical protein
MPTETKRRTSAPLCPLCVKPMQLFFREPHPDINGYAIVAYECKTCSGPVVTDRVILDPTKLW